MKIIRRRPFDEFKKEPCRADYRKISLAFSTTKVKIDAKGAHRCPAIVISGMQHVMSTPTIHRERERERERESLPVIGPCACAMVVRNPQAQGTGTSWGTVVLREVGFRPYFIKELFSVMSVDTK